MDDFLEHITIGTNMNDGTVLIPFDDIVHETELAYLLDVGQPKPVWFPKSQCRIDEDLYELEVPEWLAIEKGLV